MPKRIVFCKACGKEFATYFTNQVYCSYDCSNTRYRLDLVGLKFNRWTVISRKGSTVGGQSLWNCKCDCGTESVIIGSSLTSGNSKSCGCLMKDNPNHKTHGLSTHRVYNVWRSMVNRCENIRYLYFKDYGGRGVKVCERWHNFENFIIDMGIPELGQSIDRIDNNGNYEPSNCHWVTMKEQQNNRRDNHMITIDGIAHTMQQWSEISGISTFTIFCRLKKMSNKEAVFHPLILQKDRDLRHPHKGYTKKI